MKTTQHITNRRGSTLLLSLMIIPAGTLLFIAAMTQLDGLYRETQREALRTQARLLAESALESWDGNKANLAAAAGEITGAGKYWIEAQPGADGTVRYAAVGEAQAHLLTIRSRITLISQGDSIAPISISCQVEQKAPKPSQYPEEAVEDIAAPTPPPAPENQLSPFAFPGVPAAIPRN